MSILHPIADNSRQSITKPAAAVTALTVGFYFQQNDDIEVARETTLNLSDWVILTENTDYALAGAGVNSGGTVTLVVAADGAHRYRVRGLAGLDRATSVVQGGALKGLLLDSELDRSRIIAQEQRRDIDAIADPTIALGQFGQLYLGPLATDPTLDNQGNALIVGAEYFNTSINVKKSWNGAAWVATLSGSAYAPLASPALTGNPTAPTQTGADNSTRLATTAYVTAAIAVVLGGVSSAYDTLVEIAAAITALIGRNISTAAGSGLSGGGNLSADRSLTFTPSGLTADASPDWNADYLVTHDTSGSAPKKVKPGDLIAAKPRFSANKAATAQTGISSATSTKVTFTTEDYDVGGFYDAANSKWTPPAGPVRLTAGYNLSSGLVDQAEQQIAIRKNGTLYKSASFAVSGTSVTQCSYISVYAEANGTDFFEVYMLAGGTGTKNVDGTVATTFFQGEAL